MFNSYCTGKYLPLYDYDKDKTTLKKKSRYLPEQITYKFAKDTTMINTRGFIWAYLSVFGFLMYYQLEWAKSKDIYSDILIRFIAVFIISFLVLYLLLLLIQFGFNLLKIVPEISSFFILFYPMSLFHLGWFQYVSDKITPFFSPLLYAVFVSALCFSVYQIWVKSKEENIKAVQRSKPADLFRRVNYSFLGYLREIHSKIKQQFFCKFDMTVAPVSLQLYINLTSLPLL